MITSGRIGRGRRGGFNCALNSRGKWLSLSRRRHGIVVLSNANRISFDLGSGAKRRGGDLRAVSKARVSLFGGCNLHKPLVRSLDRHRWRRLDWSGVPTGYSLVEPRFLIYTLNEMLQAIACYNGKMRIPEEYYFLCNINLSNAPTTSNSPIYEADVALVEPNTSHEIILDGIYISRRPVLQLLNDLKRRIPKARLLTGLWFERGLVAMDEAVRHTVGAELLAMIPEAFPRQALLAAVLSRARGVKFDPKAGLRQLARSLDCPLGIVTFTWAYMPDGRALSWPVEFYREILDAAGALGLPVFEPRNVVEQAGVGFAVEKDLRHYKGAFMPVIAKPIVEFALAVVSGVQSSES